MTKKGKSSASHIGESIIKSGDCEQVLGVKSLKIKTTDFDNSQPS